MPELQDKHRVALQLALEWLPSIAQPVGVVVTGSIVRGNPGPSSDLDIVVLQNEPWRRRVQRWFNGTPVEVFFNSSEWLNHCMRDEAARGRPVMAHMLATGALVKDANGRMATVIESANEILARGPRLSVDALLRDRYSAVCQVEDALDLGGADTPDAHQIRASAVAAVTAHAYLRANEFLPRPKERLSALARIDPHVARLLGTVLTESPVPALEALSQAAELVLGTTGFFEWDSGLDDSAPRRE